MKKQHKKLSKRQICDLTELIIAITLNIPLLLAMIPGLEILHNQWLQLSLTTLILFYCGRRYYFNMYNEIFRWHLIGMNTLIGLGTLLSYGYSIYLIASNSSYMLLFETAGTIITIMLVGNLINNSVQQKVTSGIQEVISLQADSANLITSSGDINVINSKNVKIDDILLIKKGEKIPVDGIICQGYGYLDESMLTGESQIIEKSLNDDVIGGTINMGEPFSMLAKKVGSDTVLANILQKVDEIQSQKPRLQKIADKIARWFTPFIIVIAIITFFTQYYYFHAGNLTKAINIAVTVIVISCPCALGLATPLAVAVGFGKAVKEGVIFNNTSAFEKINKIDAIAFDKTGTITTGQLAVKRLIGPVENIKYIYNLEKLSTHPIAKSIFNYFTNITEQIQFTNFTEKVGEGILGIYNDKKYQLIGYLQALKKGYENLILEEINKIEDRNITLIALVINNKITNVIILNDIVRSDAASSINKFLKKNIEVYMISGDNEQTTSLIAAEVGIKNYFANVTPLDKAEKVAQIQQTGKITAYVGDGINDLVALRQADFAIAMGQGSNVAIQISDITIIKPNIFNIYKVFVLTKMTRQLIWWNFFWAFSYNLITIPLAIVGFIPPIVGAIVMGCSQLLVLLNSLVFNNIKIKY